MKKGNFSVRINAPKEKVWDILWNDESYRKWTSVFQEGSHAVTDWKEGSKVLFLSGDGNGMYSTVARNIPYELMSFKHRGEVKNGVEEPLDEKTKLWSGAMENYTLNEVDGGTELVTEMDIIEEYEDYFNGTFPKALAKVKELAEN